MSVYVDDVFIPAKIKNWNTTWCHMTADTQEELHLFAEKIGLKKSYFQDPLTKDSFLPVKPGSIASRFWHYDVTANKRQSALKKGALAVTAFEMLEIMKGRP